MTKESTTLLRVFNWILTGTWLGFLLFHFSCQKDSVFTKNLSVPGATESKKYKGLFREKQSATEAIKRQSNITCMTWVLNIS